MRNSTKRSSTGLSDLKPILRQFWDVGMKLGSRGHVPWSTRFFAPELDILVNLDVPRILAAPVSQRLGDEARDVVFTCDEARREEIRSHIRWKRAKRKAEKTGRDAVELVYEELDAERKRERALICWASATPRSGSATTIAFPRTW